MRAMIFAAFAALCVINLTACVTTQTPNDVTQNDTDSAKTQPSVQEQPYEVMGWVERVQVGTLDFTPAAKLDSGAKTSSIDAEIIRTFKENDQEYIVFRVSFDEKEGGEQIFEAPITRWVRIKRKGGDKDYIRRPVVEMTFCIGGDRIKEEVNLSDREHFTYPILIGRNMLKDNILIDSSKTFTHSPSCLTE